MRPCEACANTSLDTFAMMPGNLNFPSMLFYIGNVMPSLLDDLNKERLKFNTEIIKLLTLLFITTGGGGLALIAEGLTSPAKWILGVGGTFFAVGIGNNGHFYL